MAPSLHYDDVFYRLRSWVLGKYLDLDSFCPHLMVRRADLHRARVALRPISAGLSALLRASLRACEPAVRRAALRFEPGIRFTIYQWLRSDLTGRLLQAAYSAPGALIFACALGERPGSPSPITEQLLGSIIAGTPINQALDTAIETWLPSYATWYQGINATSLDAVINPLTAPDIVERQRLLVRRACARVPTRSLWRLPPPRLVPEDIPGTTFANARWFRVMTNPCAIDIDWADQRLEGLFAFLSKNYALVKDTNDGWCEASTLLDYARATGRFPTRHSSPTRVLGEVRAWYALREQLSRRLLPYGGTLPSCFDSEEDALRARLPPPPLQGFRDARMIITPIETATALFEEGRTMAHCVGSMIDRVIAGTSAVYHVDYGDERLTLAIDRTATGWEIAECKGFANCKASDSAIDALLLWLERVA